MKNVINRAIMAKKKMIFTLTLAIASSVWMMSEAACFSSVHVETSDDACYYYPGKLVKAPLPCEPETDCPTCQTLALEKNNTLHYLIPHTEYAQSLLETIDQQWKDDLQAYVYGIYFNTENARYIEVYGIQVSELGLFPICDEWNVLEISNVTCGYCEEYRTYNFHLTTDTVIDFLHYVKLMKENSYEGALREGIHRDIYYIPNGSTHEYLLYDFNAQVGDKLTNLWVGDTIKSATIIEIEPTTPRTFVLSVEYYQSGYLDTTIVAWIEGVGSLAGPTGRPGFIIPNSRAYSVLCAYKNGEQVYVSEMGEQYGCEYNYNPNTNHTDTIPLYAQDDSGSSTVDPVDPNQIYATLTGDVLTVHNRTGAQVTFTLNNTSVNNVAARVRKNGQPVSFTESISVELSEDGIYEILLTSEEWNYSVFGTINYVRSGTDVIKEDTTSATKKVLRGTQILIEREGKTYTLTGQEIN